MCQRRVLQARQKGGIQKVRGMFRSSEDHSRSVSATFIMDGQTYAVYR